ncbi:hypothetical protein TSUD_104550 [Trifolium subterraneum]|uniref:Protein kinase domain-containing protein n=1 Tax=Trifolium subterraneum TaxID=3900 RepID=A0A2Z6M584_TRISU|nr:hypothetical protein TSUD_104550 [Trifolium subterraneum]
MGCINSKSSAVDDSREGLTKDSGSSRKKNFEKKVSRSDSKKRVDGVLEKDQLLDGIGMKVSLIDKKANNGSVWLYDDQNETKKMEKSEVAVVVDCSRIGRVPMALEGEQVAAGWPTWLSSVAGEAINGWIPRSAHTFEKYDKIGEGTYSTVYKARDLINQKVVALKRVRFDNLDHESVKFMAREIIFLRRLDHPNVIKLEGLITSQSSRSLYLVFEYMEHDLTGLATAPSIKFSEPQVEQLHRIFKLCGSPSVDYWQKLRLPHSTVFRPPHHYRKCIADTFKEFPSAAVRLIETLLSLDPTLRGTADTALKNEFFSLEPLACDPSTLPKYSPSKEIDTKLREESRGRQGPLEGKEQKVGPRVRHEKETQSFVVSRANVDSRRISGQQGQRFPNMTSQTEQFNPHRVPPVSGFMGFRHKHSEGPKKTVNYFSGPLYQRPSHSGLLVPDSSRHKYGKEAGERFLPVSNKVNLSKPSRTSLSGNQKVSPASLSPQDTTQLHKSLGLSNGSESRRRHDRKRHSQIVDLSQTEDGTDGHASSGNNLYMSGPLLASSNNMDQMLKERDRKIQEYSRRTRNK